MQDRASTTVTRLRLASLGGSLALICKGFPEQGAQAQAAAGSAALSFDAASARLTQMSPTWQAASRSVASAEQTAKALSALNRPLVTVLAQYIAYQKTLTLDLGGARQGALDKTQDFFGMLPRLSRQTISRL